MFAHGGAGCMTRQRPAGTGVGGAFDRVRDRACDRYFDRVRDRACDRYFDRYFDRACAAWTRPASSLRQMTAWGSHNSHQ